MFIFRNETCWSRVGQEFQQGQVEETDVPETISCWSRDQIYMSYNITEKKTIDRGNLNGWF